MDDEEQNQADQAAEQWTKAQEERNDEREAERQRKAEARSKEVGYEVWDTVEYRGEQFDISQHFYDDQVKELPHDALSRDDVTREDVGELVRANFRVFAEGYFDHGSLHPARKRMLEREAREKEFPGFIRDASKREAKDRADALRDILRQERDGGTHDRGRKR